MGKPKAPKVKHIIIPLPKYNKPGRKEKEPEEWMLERMSEIYKSGQSKEACCLEFDCCINTFDRWRREYPVFAEAYEKAKLHGIVTEIDVLNRFRSDGKGNYKAIAMKLHNLAPDRYHLDQAAPSQQINIDNMNVVQQLTDEQLQNRVEFLLKKTSLEDKVIDVIPEPEQD